jgi:carbon monoxide dehydrogenase subunit G
MTRLKNQIRIDASPGDVWQVLGDLAATSEWIPGVVDASVEDDRRVCRTADGAEIHERISDYSAAQRTFSYEQSVVPLPISGSRGTMRVLADGDGARVEWDAQFEAGEDVAEMVDGYYKQTLESLRERVERGRN